MSAILKLKSDGAQALLTAGLLLGCALNVLLVWSYASRVGEPALVQAVASTSGPAGSRIQAKPSAGSLATAGRADRQRLFRPS